MGQNICAAPPDISNDKREKGETPKYGKQDEGKVEENEVISHDSPVKILVCGSTRVGKSTFITEIVNRICNKKRKKRIGCCPRLGGDSFTTCVWRVKYGKSPRVNLIGEEKTIHFQLPKKQNKRRNRELLKVAELLRELREKGKDLMGLGDIKEVVVELPLEKLQEFEFCDSPGLEEGKELDEVVKSYYRKSDLILYVNSSVSGGGGFREYQLEDVKVIMEELGLTTEFGRGKLMLVLTHFDHYLGDTGEEDEDEDEGEIKDENVVVSRSESKDPNYFEKKKEELRGKVLSNLQENIEFLKNESATSIEEAFPVLICNSVIMKYHKYKEDYNMMFAEVMECILTCINRVKEAERKGSK